MAVEQSLDERVMAEQVALSFLQAGTAASGNMLVALAATALTHFAGLPWFSVLPFAAVLVVQGVRLGHLEEFKQNPGARTSAGWRRLTERTSLVAGVGWGLMGTLTYPYAPIELQMIMMIVAAGLSSAALATLGPLRVAYLSYLLPFFAGMTLATALFFPRFSQATAALLAFYAVVMSRTSRTQADAIERSLRLSLENQALVEDLQTATKRSEEARVRAEHANEAKSQFLARMSHELRTPLNGILGVHELLLSARLPADERRFVETAHHAGNSLLSIINDVLDFSKMEADRVELTPAPFRLERLFEELMSLFAIAAQRKGLVLAHHLDPALPEMVLGDELRLRQVLTNLLGNAIKFTGKGEVSVTARPDGANGVRFAVEDTGMGVSEANTERIFESFEQGDGSISRRFGGTGLGLAISKRLVALMGGALRVKSAPGTGSEFSFTATLPASAPLEPSGRGQVGAGRSAVVRLEHARTRANATRWLTEFGFTVDVEEKPGVTPAVFVVDATRAGGAPEGVPVILVEQELGLTQTSGPSTVVRLGAPLLRSALAAALERLFSPPSTPRAPPRPADWARAKVLVVDDDAINRTIATAMLGRLGCAPMVLAGGAEALEAMAKERFDLVLMDCEMPDVDGLSATREHRRRERETEAGRLPVVALTAHATEVQRALCLAAEMDEMLTKPLSLSALEACLSRYCRAPGQG